MSRIRWLARSAVPIEPNEWQRSGRQGQYFYVKPGFFKVHLNSTNILLTSMHIGGLIGLFLVLHYRLWTLWMVCIFYLNIAILGITVGSHRLWSHGSFDAKFPLRLFLMLAQASGGVWSIKTWYRNHSVHHKWSDTDADPHNAGRGMMFAHGWFAFMKQHPLNWIKTQTIEVEKICRKDPLVQFQYDNFEIIFILTSMVLPVWTGMWFDQLLIESFLICYCLKHMLASELSGLLNSAAHTFGDQPYQLTSSAKDSPILSWFSFGEGYHNFHHAFPKNYATGEFGRKSLVTCFIELMARCGQAYNLRMETPALVKRVKERIRITMANRKRSYKANTPFASSL